MTTYMISYDLKGAAPEDYERVNAAAANLGDVEQGPTTTWQLKTDLPLFYVYGSLFLEVGPDGKLWVAEVRKFADQRREKCEELFKKYYQRRQG